MPLFKSRITHAALSLLLALFCCWAALWLVADIMYFRAQSWTETWDNLSRLAAKNGEIFRPADDDWKEAETVGRGALLFSPLNPEYREALARIYVFKDSDLLPGDPAAQASRLRALELYREAAAQRPAWPYAQMNIALTKFQLNELDGEFDRALQSATRLGPWEPDVMAVIADIGLTAWPQLSPAARQVFFETAVRSQRWGVSSQSVPGINVFWDLARTRHKEFWLCAVMPQNLPRPAEYCNPVEVPVLPPDASAVQPSA